MASSRPARSRTEPLSFAPPALGDEERENVLRSLETGWLTSGPFVEQLEAELSEYLEARHVVTTSSCTAAMQLALAILEIGPGDEVVTSAFTWPAAPNVIVEAGARPVFADVDPVTLCLDPVAAAEAVTPRTRAVLPVHYAGHPADLAALEAVCAQHGLRLVDDAAHAVEARIDDGRKVGAVGDASAFSFYANKNLAAGEGGALVLRDDALAECARSLRLHGLDRDAWRRYRKTGPGAYDVVQPGYKLNLSDLHAGVALGQLHRLTEHHARRAAQARQYDEGLRGLAGIEPAGRRLGRGAVHAEHLYVVRVDPERAGGDRSAYAEALADEGIGTGLHFLAAHRLTWYREHLGPVSLPHTEEAAGQVLSLPLSPAHEPADIDDVIEAVRTVHGRLAGR
jgi:dTDP-4-amino-4,6-dideoxygalactose transaminase